MGGPGSGNHYHWWRVARKPSWRTARRWTQTTQMRESVVVPGIHRTGGWKWFNAATGEKTSSIGYEVCTLDMSAPWLRLHYRFTERNVAIDYRVRLTTTRPRFGGLRWWFVCPLVVGGQPCNRRVGKLFLPPAGRYFGCRPCSS